MKMNIMTDENGANFQNEEQDNRGFTIYKTVGVVIALLLILAAVYFGERTPKTPITNKPKITVLPTTNPEDYQIPTPPTVIPTEKSKPAAKGFIEVMQSCGPYYKIDTCVVVRSGPGIEYPAVLRLRNGIVLRVSDTVEAEGHTWYKITFDDWLRYPDRISGEWYVAGDFVRYFSDDTSVEVPIGTKSVTAKRILVERGNEMLYAYDGDQLFMKQAISTGLGDTPTPLGTFYIYKKTPSRYMQGPIPGISAQFYDLPGVPWNLYFTKQGAVIHGAYWHDHFGSPWSHGCVNLPLDKAQQIYYWADVGTPVTIID